MSEEKESHEHLSTEEVVQASNYVLNQLIDLLIEKKVISEDEFIKKLNEAEKDADDHKKDHEEHKEDPKHVCNIGDKNCC